MSETIIPNSHRAAHDRGVKHFLASGEGPVLNQRIEITALRRDGSEFPIELSITPLKTGEMFSFAGFIRDISARKMAEAELATTQKELLESSHQAGMAEVATGVLHNVGNVLNSVNVASTCLADSLRKSKAANLSKVVALLQEHKDNLGPFLSNNAKGKQVPGYLAQLAEHLASEQGAALKELAQLQNNIEHIKDIVTMQQSFAKMSGVTEMVQVTDLLEDALKMNSSSFLRHDIQVIREFEQVPAFTTERHKVMQILVNLVRNAKHACDDSERAEKRLILRVNHGEDRVRISVTDNGVGIPPENLTRIFAHGFTTKKDGHGFGLHSGALAAREMGGSLSVQSDGPGHGATFTLELPLGHTERNFIPTTATPELAA
jgi:signal transduction histidine kinase